MRYFDINITSVAFVTTDEFINEYLGTNSVIRAVEMKVYQVY